MGSSSSFSLFEDDLAFLMILEFFKGVVNFFCCSLRHQKEKNFH